MSRLDPRSWLANIGVEPKNVAVGLLVLLAVIPLVISQFYLIRAIEALVLVLFAMSFNLLYGYTGLLSFGQSAFYGAGAYTVAILMYGPAEITPTVDTFLLAALLGVVASVLLAVVFGIICVQRGALSFSLLTLAMAMLFRQFVLEFDTLTGGDNGITFSTAEINLGVVSFTTLDITAYYYFTLVIVAGLLYLVYRIVRSPFGEMLIAIKENNERASFNGIPVKRYQWSAFVISGGLAGVAGILIAPINFVVAPGMTHWETSADPLLVTLLGGPNSFLGPGLGALLFIVIEEVVTQLTQHWHIALGIILVPIVLYFPNGVIGILSEGRVYDTWKNLQSESEEDSNVIPPESQEDKS